MAKYITKSDLQADVARLICEQINCASVLIEFKAFLNSKKFHCGNSLDNYINVNDVEARLNIALSTLSERFSNA